MESEAIPEELNDTLWSIGWQFGLVCFFAILFATTAIYISGSFFGAAVSLVVIYPWHKGTRLINKNWNNFYNAKLQQAEKAGARQLDINQGETDVYHLIFSSGTAFSIASNRRYYITLFYVGETFLAIYDGVCIDMVNRELVIRESSTNKLLYSDIKTVDYSPPNFMVQTSSGNKMSYKSSDSDEEPALIAIRKHLHSVSRSTAG